jgi:predicted aspartyl protease
VSTFFHPMTISGPLGSVTVDALVDSGATFSSLPGPVLQQLGIESLREVRLRLADGSSHLQRLGRALIGLNGAEDVMPVVFGEPESPPSIGAVTLEILLLGIDPVRETLVPVEGWRA